MQGKIWGMRRSIDGSTFTIGKILTSISPVNMFITATNISRVLETRSSKYSVYSNCKLSAEQ